MVNDRHVRLLTAALAKQAGGPVSVDIEAGDLITADNAAVKIVRLDGFGNWRIIVEPGKARRRD